MYNENRIVIFNLFLDEQCTYERSHSTFLRLFYTNILPKLYHLCHVKMYSHAHRLSPNVKYSSKFLLVSSPFDLGSVVDYLTVNNSSSRVGNGHMVNLRRAKKYEIKQQRGGMLHIGPHRGSTVINFEFVHRNTVVTAARCRLYDSRDPSDRSFNS